MRVLLVEDPSRTESTVRAITLTLPSVIQSVSSAQAVEEVLRQSVPDVIVSHHAPPKCNALEVLQVAGRVSPHVPLIVLMEQPDVGNVVECLRSGAADCIGRDELSRLGTAVWVALGLRHTREATAREEARLRASEEQFRLLADNFPGVLYLRRSDSRHTLLYLSEAVEELTGYGKPAFLDGSVTLDSLRHPNDRAACDAEIDLAVTSGRAFHLIYRLRHRLLGWRWIEEHGIGVRQNGDLVSIEGSLSDITMRRRLQRRDRRREEPEYEVAHGTITGLVNRAGFERRLERAVQSARRGGGPHALCYLDLDRFKLVNELDGHSAGDAVLRQVGRHLSEGLRTRDTVARVGGDEFVLLLEHCSPERSREVAAKVVRAFQDARFNWKEWDLVIGASIGIAPLTTESESAAAVLREADAACHAAKRRGGNCVHVAGDAELTALSADRTRGRGPLTRGRAASVGSPVP